MSMRGHHRDLQLEEEGFYRAHGHWPGHEPGQLDPGMPEHIRDEVKRHAETIARNAERAAIDFAAIQRAAADPGFTFTDTEATRALWAPHMARVRAEQEARWAREAEARP